MDDDSYSHLPGVMQEIVEVAGIKAAWEIVRTCGGRPISIPHEIKETHWLVDLVGMEAAQKISKHFTAGWKRISIQIPLARDAERRLRLIKALESGMSATDAAAVSGVHVRTAYRTRKKIKEDRQGELF